MRQLIEEFDNLYVAGERKDAEVEVDNSSSSPRLLLINDDFIDEQLKLISLEDDFMDNYQEWLAREVYATSP